MTKQALSCRWECFHPSRTFCFGPSIWAKRWSHWAAKQRWVSVSCKSWQHHFCRGQSWTCHVRKHRKNREKALELGALQSRYCQPLPPLEGSFLVLVKLKVPCKYSQPFWECTSPNCQEHKINQWFWEQLGLAQTKAAFANKRRSREGRLFAWLGSGWMNLITVRRLRPKANLNSNEIALPADPSPCSNEESGCGFKGISDLWSGRLDRHCCCEFTQCSECEDSRESWLPGWPWTEWRAYRGILQVLSRDNDILPWRMIKYWWHCSQSQICFRSFLIVYSLYYRTLSIGLVSRLCLQPLPFPRDLTLKVSNYQ